MLRTTLVATALLLLALLSSPFARAQDYSPTNPPPASFVYAGPVTDTDAAGAPTVSFRFALVIHSLAPTRIRILDAGTGQVLVDDVAPKLEPSRMAHPGDASIPVHEWVGNSASEPLTDATPAWLHAAGDTHVEYELRVEQADAPEFVFRQPAHFSAMAKAMIVRMAQALRPAAPAAQ